MLQEKDRAVKRSELLTAFAADVKKFRQQCRHLPAGPPPANETQPQKKLLSSFIAAPTTAAASATLPHWERPQSPAHSQTKRLLLASTMQLNKNLENSPPSPSVQCTAILSSLIHFQGFIRKQISIDSVKVNTSLVDENMNYPNIFSECYEQKWMGVVYCCRRTKPCS